MHQAPEINIIWCANDAIAFGAKRALKQLNMQSQVIVGGKSYLLRQKQVLSLMKISR